MQKNEPGPLPHTTYKHELRMGQRSKSIKFLEGNKGENLHDLGLNNLFKDMTQKAQAPKGKIDKLDFIKIKNFHASRK